MVAKGKMDWEGGSGGVAMSGEVAVTVAMFSGVRVNYTEILVAMHLS